MITGKLELSYIGEYGRHTVLYIDNTLVAAGFNTDKSIMLLLWCACDAKFQTIDAHINRDFTYVPNDYGPWLCRNIFSPVIGSKYDVLMTPNAAAWAYYDLIYKKGLSIDMVLSARQDLLQHIMRTYKLKHLELELKLDDNEIYKYGGFNDNYRGA